MSDNPENCRESREAASAECDFSEKNGCSSQNKATSTPSGKSAYRQRGGMSDAGILTQAYTGDDRKIKYILDTGCRIIFECNDCRNFFRSLQSFLQHQYSECGHEVFQEADAPCSSFTSDYGPKSVMAMPKTREYKLTLENIDTTNCAKYQTGIATVGTPVGKNTSLMKSQLEEIYRQEAQDTAILDTGGNVITVTNEVELSLALLNNNVETITAGATVDSDNAMDESKQIMIDGKKKKGPKKHICPYCEENYTNIQDFRAHLKTCHGVAEIRYTCTVCKMIFPSQWSIKRHLQKSHSKSGQHAKKLLDSIERNALLNVVLDRPHLKKNMVDQEKRIIPDENACDSQDHPDENCHKYQCSKCGCYFFSQILRNFHFERCAPRVVNRNSIGRYAAQNSHMAAHANQLPNGISAYKLRTRNIYLPEKRIKIEIRKDYNKGKNVISN